MSMEYKLPYTGTELIEKLRTIDNNKNEIEKNSEDIINISENIANISEDINNTSVEFDRKLANMDIQTTTSPTLYNSKDGGVRLNHMVCRTEQKSYPGYQLFDASKLPTYSIGGATSTNNGDGSFTISGSGTLSEVCSTSHTYSLDEALRILKIGTLKLSNCDLTYPTFTFGLYKPTETSYTSHKIVSPHKDRYSVEITEDDLTKVANGELILRTYIRASAGEVIIPGTIKPMVYYDGDGTWEPYVGNAPSPSPAFPQSMNNTGDCVKMLQGYYNSSDLALVNNGNFICSKYPIPCKEGDVVKIECDKDINGSLIYWRNADGSVLTSNTNENTNSKIHEVTAPSGAGMFYFRICNTNGITPSTVGKISLTVNNKYVHQIVEHGKNLFDETILLNANGWKKNDDIYTGNGYNVHLLYNEGVPGISFMPSTQYTLSFNGYKNGDSNGLSFNFEYDDGSSSKKYISYTTDRRYVLVSDVGKTVTKLSISNGNAEQTSIYNIQLEEGTVATDYEPYTEHITTFYTDQPTREGDRFVNVDNLWQVERNSAETIIQNVTDIYNDESNNVPYFIYSPPNKIYSSNNNVYSEKTTLRKFIGQENAHHENPANIVFTGEVGDTLEIMRDKYNNCKVQYRLATPVYEVLDTASQIALNSLKSFNGCTYIEVNSRVQPSETSVDYGTSRVGAMALKATNDNLIERVKRQEIRKEIDELRTALLMLNQE